MGISGLVPGDTLLVREESGPHPFHGDFNIAAFISVTPHELVVPDNGVAVLRNFVVIWKIWRSKGSMNWFLRSHRLDVGLGVKNGEYGGVFIGSSDRVHLSVQRCPSFPASPSTSSSKTMTTAGSSELSITRFIVGCNIALPQHERHAGNHASTLRKPFAG